MIVLPLKSRSSLKYAYTNNVNPRAQIERKIAKSKIKYSLRIMKHKNVVTYLKYEILSEKSNLDNKSSVSIHHRHLHPFQDNILTHYNHLHQLLHQHTNNNNFTV